MNIGYFLVGGDTKSMSFGMNMFLFALSFQAGKIVAIPFSVMPGADAIGLYLT